MVDWVAELARLPSYLAGPALAAAAIALFVLGGRRQSAIAFAIFLMLRGIFQTMVSVAGVIIRDDRSSQMGIDLLQASYFAMLLSELAGIWFVLTFPRPRAFWGEPRRGGVLLLVAGLAMVALLFVRSDFYQSYELVDGAWKTVAYGPLFWLPSLPTFTVLAALLLRDFVKDRAPDVRRSVFLVALAFLVYRAFNAGRAAGTTLRLATGVEEPNWALPTVLGTILYVPLIVVIAWLVRVGMRSQVEDIRRSSRQLAFVLAPIVAWGFLSTVLNIGRFPIGAQLRTFLNGASIVAFVAIVAWALLRGRLFDIDNKVRLTIRASTVGAVFLGIFVIVTQLASGFFQSTYGWAFGGLAAGAALVALHPIQRVAERVATAAVPPPAAQGALAHPDRVAAYRKVLADAYGDGNVDRTERRMLDTTRDALGLSIEDAARIEAEYVKSP